MRVGAFPVDTVPTCHVASKIARGRALARPTDCFQTKEPVTHEECPLSFLVRDPAS